MKMILFMMMTLIVIAYDVDICNKAYDDEDGLSYPYYDDV
jgi:hypothetical protein